MKIENLTPKEYLCIAGLGCPAVYATDAGTLILVGERLAPTDPRLQGEVKKSANEEIIEIPAGLLAQLRKNR